MELPFPLYETHRAKTKSGWKIAGLNCSEEEFEAIYETYITSSKCELCKEKYKSRTDRCMDHDHETGKFRNICCQTCNKRRRDVKIRTDNKSGYKHIHKDKSPTCNQGFIWRFEVKINGKNKYIKSSVNLEKVIQFRDQWFKDNPDYHT